MRERIEKQVPEKKLKIVKELVNLIKGKKTFLIVSIKNLPASQFQEIGKKLRGKATVKVPKKNLIFKAIEESGIEKAEELKKEIKEDTALLFSDIDSFKLASELIENKRPAKGKTGQITPVDIEVEAGPTELVPGPAISELGALGIKIQIDKGKIHIKEPKVIVKEGEKLSENAASLMNKLDIKPFSIGFIPLSAYDTREEKLYVNIQIDKEGVLENLKNSFGKALAFAIEIGLVNENTVKFLLSKARIHEIALSNLTKDSEASEEKPEEKKEDTQPDSEVNSSLSHPSVVVTEESTGGEDK